MHTIPLYVISNNHLEELIIPSLSDHVLNPSAEIVKN
jgi:hypothetical protein